MLQALRHAEPDAQLSVRSVCSTEQKRKSCSRSTRSRPTELRFRHYAECIMKLDPEKIDRAVLALLRLGLHQDNRAWKGFDWDAMNRLHEKRYISDPVGKAKSVVFTEEGLLESERLLEELFGAN